MTKFLWNVIAANYAYSTEFQFSITFKIAELSTTKPYFPNY